MFKEEIAQIKSDVKTLRSFGLVVGGVFGAVGLLWLWKGHSGSGIFLTLAALLIVPGLFFPKALKHVNRAWMILALLLGWVMTRVILSIVFYAVLTPIALIMRLGRHDLLNRKYPDPRETFWIPKEDKRTPESYEKQF